MGKKTIRELLKMYMTNDDNHGQTQEMLDIRLSSVAFRGTDKPTLVDKGGWLSLYRTISSNRKFEVSNNNCETKKVMLSSDTVAVKSGPRATQDMLIEYSSDCKNFIKPPHSLFNEKLLSLTANHRSDKLGPIMKVAVCLILVLFVSLLLSSSGIRSNGINKYQVAEGTHTKKYFPAISKLLNDVLLSDSTNLIPIQFYDSETAEQILSATTDVSRGESISVSLRPKARPWTEASFDISIWRGG